MNNEPETPQQVEPKPVEPVHKEPERVVVIINPNDPPETKDNSSNPNIERRDK